MGLSLTEYIFFLCISHTEFFYNNNNFESHTDLCRPSVHHWRRKDGHYGGVWVEQPLLQHSGMLFHAPGERHVVIFRPAAQRV